MTSTSLRAWRKRLNLSQRAAAEALGVSLRQYSDYERGVADVPHTVALACAAVAYGLPPMR